MSGEAPVQDSPRGSRSSRATLRSLATTDPVDAGDPAGGERRERKAMMLHSVTLTVSDNRCSVSVEVREGGEQSVAITEGACAAGGIERLVAEATVRAVGGLDPGALRVAVDAVAVAPVGGRLVATAALAQPLGAGEEPLAGAAAVGPSGPVDAVARAVLEALARRSTSA